MVSLGARLAQGSTVQAMTDAEHLFSFWRMAAAAVTFSNFRCLRPRSAVEVRTVWFTLRGNSPPTW